MDRTTPWLDWAVELQAMAQAGLYYGTDPYGRERYERIRAIAAEMVSFQADIPLEKTRDLFCCETGYQTPKLDTRAAIFQDEKILLVRENDGRWSLPGGWVDVNVSVKENTVKEVREEAGLDSILQAAGRCNREGKRPAGECIVTIFQSETPPPTLFEIPVAAGRRALSCCDSPDSQEAIRCYFQELLDLKGPEALDQKRILAMMEQDHTPSMPFRKIAERFRLIDSETKTVYIPLEEGEELVRRLRSGEHSRALFRALGQYGVSVYPQHFAALDLAGGLEILEDGSAVLTDLALYDNSTGLSLAADSGKALFI